MSSYIRDYRKYKDNVIDKKIFTRLCAWFMYAYVEWVYVCVWVCVSVSVSVCECECVYVWVHMCVCVCVCVSVYSWFMYTYECTWFMYACVNVSVYMYNKPTHLQHITHGTLYCDVI